MRGRKGFSSLEEVILVVLVLSVGFLGGVVTTYEVSDFGEEVVYDPQYNLSCPEPKNEVQMVSRDSEESSINNYIQAPYTEVDYNFEHQEVSVEADDTINPEGKSMRPTVFSGNTLLLKDFEGGEIKEGEILRYEDGDGFVIHRVQANYLKTSDYLLMRGDNNEYSSRITKDQVTHKVIGVLYTEGANERASFSD